jgi:tetratricopeptide (TPR) repeat protein
MPYDVFISYASQDLAFAQELNDRLVDEGFKVWFDKTRLSPGFDWYSEIERGCENSRVLLPVLTPRWKNSDWTKFETYGAEAVIPVLFEGVWSEVSTPPLERFQAEIIDTKKQEQSEWNRLFSDIRRIRDSQLPEKATHLTHVHYRANDYFTGRERELIQIHEELHTKPKTGLTSGRVRAITAMRGAGKTTLARQYIEKFWKCYTQIFWIDCRAGLEREFAHIHDFLFPDRKDIGLKDKDKAASALNELNGNITRLLILDNADELEDLVIDWIPKIGACYSLITSCYGAFGGAIKTIHIFLLEKEPSVEFMKKRTGRNFIDAELSACEILVEKLGFLPLALEQAAAYIEQQGDCFGVCDYLLLYNEAIRELLDIKTPGVTEYPDSVFATWKSTISKLTPTGRAILHLASYLACVPISVEQLFQVSDIIADHSEKFFGGSPKHNQSGSKTTWLRNELAKLKAYSMIEYNGQSFSMHPLLQVVEKLTDTDEIMSQTWDVVVEILNQIAPPASWADDCRLRWSISNHKLWAQILLHIINLKKLMEGRQNIITPSGKFSFLSLNAYASQNQIAEAMEICKDLMAYLTQTPSTDRLFFIQVQESLGYLQKQNSKYNDALQTFQELSKACIEIYGELNPLTLRVRHNIACLLERLNQSKEAEEIMIDVLEKRKRILGENDYDTITSIHDQGWLLSNSEVRWKDAEPLFRHAFEQWKATLGLDNPDTRIAAGNLARLIEKKGDFAQAEMIQRDLILGTELVLGKQHVDCFGLKHNLALFIFNTGRFADALPIIEDVVEGYRKNLPPEHRDMLTALQDLGTVLGKLNRHEEAEKLLREALTGYEKTQGLSSKDTLRSVENLAVLLDRMERFDEAKTLHLRCIQATISKDNVTPLEIRRAAGNCFHIGEFGLAEQLLFKVLNLSFEIPGTKCHLARIYLLTNRLMDAQKQVEEARQYRAEAPQYVKARILWFSIAFAFIEKKSHENYFGQIRKILLDNDAFMEWSMKPVLDYFQTMITENQFNILSALVAVMNDPTKLQGMEKFPEWQEAEPQSFD